MPRNRHKELGVWLMSIQHQRRDEHEHIVNEEYEGCEHTLAHDISIRNRSPVAAQP